MSLTKFSDIPLRANGTKIDASWFNTLRLLLIQIFGDATGELAQSIGQTDSNQAITDLSNIDADEFSRIDVEYSVRRQTDSTEVFQSGNFTLQWLALSQVWRIVGHDANILGDDAQIEFSLFVESTKVITVRESTTALAGSGHVGTITTKAKRWVI